MNGILPDSIRLLTSGGPVQEAGCALVSSAAAATSAVTAEQAWVVMQIVLDAIR